MVELDNTPRYTVSGGDTASLDFKMITFVLAGKEYGVDIMSVKEIQKGSRFTYVPNAPEYVRGVYNLRGDIIPVINLRTFFGLPEYENKGVFEDILILRQGDAVVGVLVDGIQKVVGVALDEIQPAHPLFADVVGLNYIFGVVEKDEYLYVILDTSVILGQEKQEAAAEPEEAKTVDKSPVDVPVSQVQEVPATVVSTAVVVEAVPVVLPPEPVAVEVAEPVAVVASRAVAETPQYLKEDNNFSDGQDGPSEGFYESLFEYANFCPSELNQTWLFKRYDEWLVSHPASGKLDSHATKEFLETFYSVNTAQLWNDDMVDEFCELLGQDDQKITHVWNAGCGEGYTAYSIAGGLFLRDKKCKIYATDSDLMAITGAAGHVFAEGEIPPDFKLAMVNGAKGWQFTNEVKNTIIFEYHDIANEHVFPKLDVIVVRDMLSFVDEDVFMKFFERIFKQAHAGTLLIIGDNEVIMDNTTWSPVQSHHFSAYRKIV